MHDQRLMGDTRTIIAVDFLTITVATMVEDTITVVTGIITPVAAPAEVAVEPEHRASRSLGRLLTLHEGPADCR